MSEAPRQKLKIEFPPFVVEEPPPRRCDVCGEMRAAWQFDAAVEGRIKSAFCLWCRAPDKPVRWSNLLINIDRGATFADATIIQHGLCAVALLEKEIGQRSTRRAA